MDTFHCFFFISSKSPLRSKESLTASELFYKKKKMTQTERDRERQREGERGREREGEGGRETWRWCITSVNKEARLPFAGAPPSSASQASSGESSAKHASFSLLVCAPSSVVLVARTAQSPTCVCRTRPRQVTGRDCVSGSPLGQIVVDREPSERVCARVPGAAETRNAGSGHIECFVGWLHSGQDSTSSDSSGYADDRNAQDVCVPLASAWPSPIETMR